MKTFLVLVFVLAIAALGGGAYYYFYAFDETAVLRQAWEGDGSIHCTFEEEEEEVTLTARDGDYLLAFNQDSSDEEESFHMLRLDESVYSWSEKDGTGLKQPKDTPGVGLGDDFIDEAASKVDQENFSCSRFINDELLQPPDDIEFDTLEERANEHYDEEDGFAE